MTEQYAIYITAAIIASMPVIGAYIVIDTNKRMAKRIAKRTAQALLEEAEYASEHFSSADEDEAYAWDAALTTLRADPRNAGLI